MPRPAAFATRICRRPAPIVGIVASRDLDAWTSTQRAETYIAAVTDLGQHEAPPQTSPKVRHLIREMSIASLPVTGPDLCMRAAQPVLCTPPPGGHRILS
jgi:hypothetical protein